MDREAVIRMAREAGFDPHDMTDDFTCNLIDIERFAKLVAAQKEAWSEPQFECPRCGHCCKSDLATVGEVGVWGAVQCEPQEEVENGWCDWVCPKPQGYLMQCCDCELIHEVDFRVVRYESENSEVYEVVDDPNLQAQMRMKRRDDLSPKQWVGLTDEEIHGIDGYEEDRKMYRFARAIEQALKERNHG